MKQHVGSLVASAALALTTIMAPAAFPQKGAKPTATNASPSRLTVAPWTLLAAIEVNRPVFSPRVLTADERAEVQRLSASYSGAGKTMATLGRLVELGQTGDREAMLAVRTALKLGAANDMLAKYEDTQQTRDFHAALTGTLAALWTAHIWKLHGVEAAGIPYMNACVSGLSDANGNPSYGYFKPLRPDPRVQSFQSIFYGHGSSDRTLGCGFNLVIASGEFYVPEGKHAFRVWRRQSDGKLERAPSGDFYLSDVLFFPVWGDGAFLEAKFEKYLSNLREGYPYVSLDAPTVHFDPAAGAAPEFQLTRLFYYGYADRTGRRAELDLARDDGMAKNAKLYADMRREREAAASLARQERARDEAQWTALMKIAKAGGTSPQLASLSDLSERLGGTYLDAFYALPPEQQGIVMQSPTTSGGYSGGYNPNQSVEVRTYDQNGTYTGSTTTSAFWADVMKMTSGAPR